MDCDASRFRDSRLLVRLPRPLHPDLLTAPENKPNKRRYYTTALVKAWMSALAMATGEDWD